MRLQKKFEYNNYQSQQRDKISNDQDIYLPGTCVIIGDSILNGLIEENLRDHLLDLNMDILDNRNITSKKLGRKGLHLNKAGSPCLAKNIYKLWKF